MKDKCNICRNHRLGYLAKKHTLIVIGSTGRSWASTSTVPILTTLNIVFPVTLPKIVCFLSIQSHAPNVMKNWLWLVCGLFALAIATCPRWLNLIRVWNSSLKGRPQIDAPPEPDPVGSPVCIYIDRNVFDYIVTLNQCVHFVIATMKSEMTLCMGEPS